MENYDEPELMNVGVGEELTIAELAVLVARVIGYAGRIAFDPLASGWDAVRVARPVSHPQHRLARADPPGVGDCVHVQMVHNPLFGKCVRVRDSRLRRAR
jgi:hypothetical protein